MVIDRRKALLFSAASVLRFALALVFPGLPDILTGRVEISTPVTSFKRCEVPFIDLIVADIVKYRKVSTCTLIMYLHTMVVSSTKVCSRSDPG